jgi:hypothetical protein
MKYILEKNKYYKEDDIVYIQYWYNQIITPVVIKQINKNKYLVSHKIEESKIMNAPDETISRKDIISKITT